MPSSRPPAPRSDLIVFASMLEARKARLESDGKTGTPTQNEVLSKLFELVHDARDAVTSKSNLSIIAADIALYAMELAKVDGKISSTAAKKDSIRVIDARKHAVRDSSYKHAVVHHDKTVLWGAKLEADFEITDLSLKPCLSAIRMAFDTLNALNVKVGKIQITNGFVRVFPEDGVEDPRHEDLAIPVSPEF